jgi:hypothetical protein
LRRRWWSGVALFAVVLGSIGCPIAARVGATTISHTSTDCNLRSRADAKWVSAEVGDTGSLTGLLRADARAIGLSQEFRCTAIGATSWAISSLANTKYASAELRLHDASYGFLRAHATTIGAWERFTFVYQSGCGCYAIRAANNRCVSAELEYSGALADALRARATSVGPWEQFDIVPVTSVVSDQVTFTATGQLQGTYKSTTCALASDGETKPYSCGVSFHVGVNFGSGGCAVSGGSLKSSDGTTTFAGRCGASCAGLGMSGNATEADAPENGKPSNKYPATVNLTLTRLSGCLSSVYGTIVVSESSTSP